jgi:hypothetical protein
MEEEANAFTIWPRDKGWQTTDLFLKEVTPVAGTLYLFHEKIN